MPSQVETPYSRVTALFFIKGQENTSGIQSAVKSNTFCLVSCYREESWQKLLLREVIVLVNKSITF